MSDGAGPTRWAKGTARTGMGLKMRLWNTTVSTRKAMVHMPMMNQMKKAAPGEAGQRAAQSYADVKAPPRRQASNAQRRASMFPSSSTHICSCSSSTRCRKGRGGHGFQWAAAAACAGGSGSGAGKWVCCKIAAAWRNDHC